MKSDSEILSLQADLKAKGVKYVVGAYTDWTPLQDRELLFPEPVDRSDAWQFTNFRVA